MFYGSYVIVLECVVEVVVDLVVFLWVVEDVVIVV